MPLWQSLLITLVTMLLTSSSPACCGAGSSITTFRVI